MKIAYSQWMHPKAEGMAFRNPRFFSGVEEGATEVHVFGHWPDIADAYLAAGVPVVEHDPRPTSPGIVIAEAPADFVNPVQAEPVTVRARRRKR